MPENDPNAEQEKQIAVILNPGSQALSQAATACWPAVKAHVLTNSGTIEDAQDLVQEAVIVVYRQAQTGTLRVSGALEAYLIGVCKKIWQHRLREKKRDRTVTNQLPMEYMAEDPAEKEWRLAARYRLYLEKLDTLGDPCRRLIELDCQKVPLKEIAALLNYTYDYVRQKKMDCLAALLRIIRQDARFKDLL